MQTSPLVFLDNIYDHVDNRIPVHAGNRVQKANIGVDGQ
jgi:hypothetical protein